MPRPDKERKVAALADELRRAQAAVLTDYRGLTVQETSELRTELDAADTRFAVVKNRLTKLAMRDVGLDDGLTDLLEGPTAIAFVHGDPVAGVKRLVDAMKRFRVLELKGGFAEGRALSAEQIRSLAALESREVMLAKVAGLAKMDVQRMAWMLQALQSRFVSLMGALREKLPADEQSTETEASAGAEQPAAAEEEPAEVLAEPQPETPVEQPAEASAEKPDAPPAGPEPAEAAAGEDAPAAQGEATGSGTAGEPAPGDHQTEQPSDEQSEGGT